MLGWEQNNNCIHKELSWQKVRTKQSLKCIIRADYRYETNSSSGRFCCFLWIVTPGDANVVKLSNQIKENIQVNECNMQLTDGAGKEMWCKT